MCFYAICIVRWNVLSGESLETHLQLSKCEEGGAHSEELQAYWWLIGDVGGGGLVDK